MSVTINLLTWCIIPEGLSFHHHHSGHLKSYKWSWVYKNNCCFNLRICFSYVLMVQVCVFLH